ncbi:MAG: hypothetical protein ABW250_00050 [Pyrinomonadaceae bacterium]
MRLIPCVRSRLFRVVPAVLFIAVAFGTATAQQPAATPTPVEVAIQSAIANIVKVNVRPLPNGTSEGGQVKGWAVFVTFTKELDRSDAARAENPANYRIIDANTGTQMLVSEAKFQPLTLADGREKLQIVRLVLPSSDALNKDDLFFLFALNQTFKGVPAASVPSHEVKIQPDPADAKKVAVDEQGTNGMDAHNEPKPKWGLKSSKGRDDSDIYAAYELTMARGVAKTGTGDVKFAIPFYSNFWKRTSKFSPLVDFKASSNEKADPDSLKFALEWFLPVHVGDDPNETFPFTSVDLINSGKIEAPKDFDNINSVWEMRWLFPSAQIPGSGKPFRLFIDPFVGSELGKNLKSPMKEIEGHGIARLMTGANLIVQVPVKNLNALKQLEFTTSYIRRWPLKRELMIGKDAAGADSVVSSGKGPKDYVDSKFTVKVNDFFGPYIGYEWGRLPPDYKFVDHKWTFGLLFKTKVRAK